MKRKIILIVLVISILGVFGYYYVCYGGVRNVLIEEVVFIVFLKSIIEEFGFNIEKLNIKYLEKVIVIKGNVIKII